MRKSERIKNVLLTECMVDYVGLWEAISHVEYGLSDASAQKVREVTMDLIGELMHEGLVKAGDLNEISGFVPWQHNPEEALKRISDEWSALGHEPNLGDIVWLTTTEAGDAKVELHNQ